MENRNLKRFEKIIPKIFTPLANRVGAKLHRVADGVYQIDGQKFAVRVRLGAGHCKDVLVTLFLSGKKSSDIGDLSGEVGLGVIMQFHGAKAPESLFDNEEQYIFYVRELATQAERFLLPYLLNMKTDFSEVQEFVAKNAREAAKQVSKYQFPKNVRKEWP